VWTFIRLPRVRDFVWFHDDSSDWEPGAEFLANRLRFHQLNDPQRNLGVLTAPIFLLILGGPQIPLTRAYKRKLPKDRVWSQVLDIAQ
jgi:hypothetical protein